jgi:hypothetical protein
MKTLLAGPISGALLATALSTIALTDKALSHPPFISISPDGQAEYVCGREAQSAGGCFTYWCQSYEMSEGERRLTEKEEDFLLSLGLKYSPWSPCYVNLGSGGGGNVHQGGVAWWGWGEGSLGASELDGFWVRDYRTDSGRNSCGYNCSNYGFARRLNSKPGCYYVSQDWRTASEEGLTSRSQKAKDGWRDMVYCMRPAVAD